MRVLFLGRNDDFNNKSSLEIVAKSTFKHMLEQDPEMYVTWVIPTQTRQEDLDEHVLSIMPDPKRIGFLPVQAGLGGRTIGYFMTQDLWYAATQTKVRVPYDVVLSNHLAMTPIWKTVLTNRYMANRYAVDVPIVNWQMWTATHQQLLEVPEYYAGEADIVAESLSSLFAINVWESETLYRGHLETMKEYVKPSVVRKIMDQSHVVSNGVDKEAMDKVYARRVDRMQRKEGPRLFWGGRLVNQKKPRITFPLMEKARLATGAGVVVSTSRPASDPDVAWTNDTFQTWALHTGVNRDLFHSIMSEGDVVICNSVSESYGIAWLEMLAAGMLVVFERQTWTDALLPDWYPFVLTSHADMVKAAVYLLKTWPDEAPWTTLVPKVREWIDNEHTEVRCAERLGTILRQAKASSLAADRAKAIGSIGQLADAAAESLWTGEPIPEDAIWEKMTKESESKREFGHSGDVISKMYLRRALEAGRWRDVCRSSQVEFVRREDG